MKRIEIIVLPGGQTHIATKGFSGTACRSASQFVEQALGTTAQEELTQEFFQLEVVQQSQSQRQ